MMGTTTRKQGAAVALLVLLLLCSCSRGPEPKNILFIAIDTMRADHMSLYGYDRETTPRLDAFARTATVFDRAHSPSSWTRASFASYFTGLRPSVHGCEGRDDSLAEDHRTLAECFGDAGWATAAVYSNYNIAASLGFDQGFDVYDHPPANAGYDKDYEITDAAAVNARVLAWLHDERPAEDPWFLFVLYMDPHDPYLPHEEHVFGKKSRLPIRGSRDYLERIDRRANQKHVGEVRQGVRNLYDGEVAYVDAHIGALLDELDAAGLAEDTIVIVCSDHGEGLWDHDNYRGHGKQIYQEQIHVPLAVRWPGLTEPGLRVPDPVNVTDVFATLAGEYGLAKENEYQGRSLLETASRSPRTSALYSVERLDEVNLRTFIDWPWKVIVDDTAGTSQLFNLELDPAEKTSITDEHPDRLRDLTDRMNAITAADSIRHAELDIDMEASRLSEKELRELRALGYVK